MKTSELKVVKDFYDLMLYLTQRIEKFPRHHRYTLGTDMERRLNGVLALLLKAKYRSEKVDVLADANLELEVLRFQSRLAADLKALPIGLFGASTGAAAALKAAAARPDQVAAVVSRGGRPDLAGADLERVRAPTLLIVGGDDGPVVGMNEDALAKLGSPVKELVVVPGAGHLFEEPGKLDEVARLAAAWFTRHLSAGGTYAG